MGMHTRIHLKERKGGVCQWGRQTGKTNIPCSFARFAENGVGGARGRSRVGQVHAHLKREGFISVVADSEKKH